MSTPPLRVLVTASSLDLDGTAEGSCSVKYLELLVQLGHEVAVVNGANNLTESPAPWLPGVEVVDLDGPVESEPRRGPVGRRIGAARSHVAGFGPLDRQRRARWRRTLPRAVRSFRPDVLVTRAAGLDITPHLAVRDLDLDLPWVAHLHDPWPLSAFPNPYRRHEGLISRRQEAVFRRLLRVPEVLAFPSARHRAWQLGQSGVDAGDRAVVVAHLGVEGGLVRGLEGPDPTPAWVPPPPGEPLRLIHCGSLFHQRDPRVLLEALGRVVAEAPVGAPPLHLTLVGWLDPKLTATAEWPTLVEPLVAAGALDVRAGNIGYVESIAALCSSDVLLTYVVGMPESPQFPAKLADHFSLGHPMLAIAPRASTPADLVGTASPAFVDRDEPGAIERALRDLLARRAAGSLHELRPSEGQRHLVSPAAVGEQVDRALHQARATHRGVAQAPSRSSASGSTPSG